MSRPTREEDPAPRTYSLDAQAHACLVEVRNHLRLLAAKGVLTPRERFEAEVYLLTTEEGGLSAALDTDRALEVHLHGNYWFVRLLGAKTLLPGDRLTVKFTLQSPMALTVGARLMLSCAGQQIGGALVTGC